MESLLKKEIEKLELFNTTSNMQIIKTFLISAVITFLAVWSYSEIRNNQLEKRYNECYKQNKGSLIISCDTDKYFVYRAEEEVIVSLKATKTKVNTNNDIDTILLKYFPENAEIVKAVLTHESQLKVNAISYNCFYKNGVVHIEKVKGAISTFCKKGHTQYSWSVDCGVAMLNYHEKTCPAYTMELEPSIKKMRAMYDKRGLQPWVSYNSGSYKQYLRIN